MCLWVLLAVPLAVAQVPEIANISETVDSGSSLAILGEGMAPGVEVWLWQPGSDSRTAILRSAALTPPALPSLPPPAARRTRVLGMPSGRLLIAAQLGEMARNDDVVPTVSWVKNTAGFSRPYYFNRPQLVFSSNPEVLPGERLRLFGRNLAPKDCTSGEKYDYPVAFESADGRVRFGQVLDVDPQDRQDVKAFQLQVRVPTDLPPGSYHVKVHVLHGGPAAWSNSLPVSVIAARHWVAALAWAEDHPLVTMPQAAPPRVLKLVGAAADGFTDDTAAIQGAIDELASADGGVLTLPAGSYALSHTLHVRSNVVLQGAGRAATQLLAVPHQPFRPGFPFAIEKLFAHPLSPGSAQVWGARFVTEGILIWLDDRSGVQDLSLLAGAGCSLPVVAGVEDAESVARDIFLRRVEILNPVQSTYAPPEVNGTGTGGIRVFSATRGFTLVHSRIVSGNPLFFDAGRKPHQYARIEGNTFRGYPNNQYDAVHLRKLVDSIFEDNEIFNARRAFVSQKGISRNWICGNQIHHISGYGNGSEIIMSEHFGSKYRARVKMVSGRTLTFAADLNIGPGDIEKAGALFYAYVLSGRGTGQFRQVLNNGRDSLELDEPWTVAPDETSTVALIASAVGNYVVCNRITDTRGPLQVLYVSGFENLIAGNELYNASDLNIGASVYEGDFMPVAFNLILDNRLVNSNGIRMYADKPSRAKIGDREMYQHGPLFANTVRRNQVWSPSTPPGSNQGWNIWWPRNPGEPHSFHNPAVEVRNGAYNIVESCYLFNNSLGVEVTGGIGNVVRNNLMDQVSRPMTDEDSAGTYFEPAVPSREGGK